MEYANFTLIICIILYLFIGFIKKDIKKKRKKAKKKEIITTPITKKEEHPSFQKVYSYLDPINVVDINKITDNDIKNLLLSLKDEESWSVGYFGVNKDHKNNTYYYFTLKNKKIELTCRIENGKLTNFKISKPIEQEITSHIENFTIAIWSLFKKGSEEYNEKQSKINNSFSKEISDIVPKVEKRDNKINDILD